MQPPDIDGYRIVAVLGSGRSGTVYDVLHPQTREPMALKLLRTPELLEVDEKRFMREFDLAAKMVHPHVVQVFSAGRFEGSPYYTMERVNGGNMRGRIHANSDMDEVSRRQWYRETAALVDQIMDALAYLHSRGIIHRDLKPENIIVGAGMRAKIVDFGLAFAQRLAQRLTRNDEILGTAAYLAPEMLLGQELDHRVDIYAMGVILYELLSGRQPFAGDDMADTLANLLYNDPPPLRTVCSEVDAEVEAVVMKMMAREAWDRYNNAEDARRALAAAFRKMNGHAGGPLAAIPQGAVGASLFEPRMVGRVAAFDVLTMIGEEVAHGGLRVAVVRGDVGMGKTRLITEFARRYEARGFSVWWSGCRNNDTSPLRAIVPWLRKLGLPDLEGLLEKVCGNEPRPPAAWRFHLYEMVVRQLRAAQARSPVLLVLEDLQWADRTSLDALRFIVESFATGAARVLIVATVREDASDMNHALHSFMEDYQGQVWLIDVPLHPLRPPEVGEMISSMLGNPVLSPGLVAAVSHATHGIPLLVGETIKVLCAQDAVAQSGQGLVLQQQLPPLTPDSILAARLIRLTKQQRDVLQHAAVIGTVFTFESLRAACGTALGALVDVLEELRTWRLVFEVTDAAESSYSFYHEKLREVVIKHTPPEVSADIHLKIGIAIEELDKKHPSMQTPFALSWHYLNADSLYRAQGYQRRAAQLAMRSFSYRHAVSYFRQLLEQCDAKTPAAERRALQEDLADALAAEGDAQAALELLHPLITGTPTPLERARLMRKVGASRALLGAAEAAVEAYAAGLTTLGFSIRGPGSPHAEGPTRVSSRSRSMPNTLDRRRSQEEVELCAGIIDVLLPGMAPGHVHLLGQAALRQRQMAQVVGDNKGICAADIATATLAARTAPPHIRTARPALDRAAALLDSLSSHIERARRGREIAWLHFLLGNIDDAIRFAAPARELSNAWSDLTGMPDACIIEGEARVARGELELALALAVEAARAASLIRVPLLLARACSLHARIWMHCGEIDIEPLLPAEATLPLHQMAWGMLRRRQGRLDEAVTLLEGALEGLLAESAGAMIATEAGIELAMARLALHQDIDALLQRLDPLTRDLPLRRGAWLRVHAQWCERRRQDRQALASLEQSVAMLEKGGYRLELANTLFALADCQNAQLAGRGRAAKQRATALLAEMGFPAGGREKARA